jgi:hypothetical protein
VKLVVSPGEMIAFFCSRKRDRAAFSSAKYNKARECSPNSISNTEDEDMLALDAADAISFAFGLFNLLRLISYIPQIAAVARDHHGAHAISLTCWTVWIGANATTALYSWVKLADFTLASVSAFNTVCCALILFAAGYKRFIFSRSRIVRQSATRRLPAAVSVSCN